MLVSEQGVTLSPARPRPTTPTHLLSYTTLFRSVPSEPFLPTRTRRPTPARSDGWSYRCSCTGQRWYGRSRRDPERCRARSEERRVGKEGRSRWGPGRDKRKDKGDIRESDRKMSG